MKPIILSATVVLLTATMLAVSSLAVSAQDYSGQYASDGQYASATEQEGCGWYWDYNLNKSGGWEWWCWSPEFGWWYGESESGNKKIIAPKTSGDSPLQIII